MLITRFVRLVPRAAVLVSLVFLTLALGGSLATWAASPGRGPSVSTTVLVSEFRTHGPSGAVDEFVELYNLTASQIDIGGWQISASNSNGFTGTRVTVNSGTILPAYGHFLAANGTGYSGAVVPDQTYGAGIANDGGIALLDSSGAVLDQVGMSAGSAYGEGTRLAPLGANTDQGYERRPGGASGGWLDTDNNAADFQVTAPSDPQNLSSLPVPPSGGTPAPSATPATATPVATTTPTRTWTATPSATRTATLTLSPTRTPTCVPGTNYTVTRETGATIVAGIVDTGNHCDNCVTTVPLPFSFRFYGGPFTTAIVGSNGTLQFNSNNTGASNTCMPVAGISYAILPLWDDLLTTELLCPGCGVFTSVSGSEPDRIFNIEWRACIVQGGSCQGAVNFEVRLYEATGRIDLVYAALAGDGGSATVGVQDGIGQLFTQYQCNQGGITPGTLLIFSIPRCTPPTSTITPSHTAISTPTSESTSTTTLTPTPTVGTPVVALVGHVTYQGISQPSARNQQAITLTLCYAGLAQTFVENTDAQGFFTETLGIPPGSYNYRIKSYKNLANAGNMILGAGTTNAELGTLRAGDTDNSNTANATDFNRLKAAFGTLTSPFTDFNNDGITNSADFNLLKSNFGMSGQTLTCP